jgi:hypothetical protein
MHEEKVRFALESKKAEVNPGVEHPVSARKYNKND